MGWRDYENEQRRGSSYMERKTDIYIESLIKEFHS